MASAEVALFMLDLVVRLSIEIMIRLDVPTRQHDEITKCTGEKMHEVASNWGTVTSRPEKVTSMGLK
jgi:hypothetical protein